MLFFNSQSKRIIWWVLYAFFCALIGSLGIFRFATVNDQLLKNTVFAALLIVFIMAIMVSILRFYSIQVTEDKNPLANKIALAVVLYFFLLGGGTFFLSEGLLHIANAFFDKSEADSHQVVITNIFTRHNSRGQAYSQGVVVPSWSDKYPSLIDLDAPLSAAELLKIGDNIIIKTKKGGLGYEWIVEVSEVEKTQKDMVQNNTLTAEPEPTEAQETGIIKGFVFSDINKNGLRDPNEGKVSDRIRGIGIYENMPAFALIDKQGFYKFILRAGDNYSLGYREVTYYPSGQNILFYGALNCPSCNVRLKDGSEFVHIITIPEIELKNIILKKDQVIEKDIGVYEELHQGSSNWQVWWDIYKDKDFNFEFAYPKAYDIHNDLYFEDQKGGSKLIKFDNIYSSSANFFRQASEDLIGVRIETGLTQEYKNIENFLLLKVMKYCGGSGPMGDIECTDRTIFKKELAKNDLGFVYYKFFLKYIEHFNNTKTAILKGPIYFFEIPYNEQNMAGVFFELQETYQTDPYILEILEQMISTFKLTNQEF